MSKITFNDVGKVYDNGFEAVKNFNLEIGDGEFIVFVGPSGCGKSTTLRMIAGLEDITSGEIKIDGQLINDVEPQDRNIAMVFQNYALYPHMTVYNNMAYALKNKKIPKDEIDKKIKKAADLLEITPQLEKKPKQLSGGQKQRVALGRAIVRNPKAFLMDEPLSNLDAKLRTQMRTEINKLHKDLDTTMIYVTHDQTEAMTLGDRIVVMKDGVIQQVDSPNELYDHPINQFVAGFIGSPQMNFLDIGIQHKDGKLYGKYKDKEFVLPQHYAEILRNYPKTRVVMGIRPEHIYFENKRDDLININAVVNIVESLGSEEIVYLKNEDEEIVVRDYHNSAEKLNEEADLFIDPLRIHLFDKDTGMSLLEYK